MIEIIRMNILIFLAIIPAIMLIVSNVYAGGPRLDYSETYEDVPGAPVCWVDGYDAGFAGKYDKDRAQECKDIPGDQYNASWIYGCEGAGLTEKECSDIKEGNNDDINHESLQEENRRIVMTMDMKMEGIAHLIKKEVKDVMITTDHIMKDS
jgi:hypothetical protein